MTVTPVLNRLDVLAFARAADSAEGRLSWHSLPRLRDHVHEHVQGHANAEHTVQWQVSGQLRSVAGSAPQVWLHLRLHTSLPLVCQRCLEPMDALIAVDRWFRFVRDETQALALDDELQEDVLVLDPRFNLHALIEDELILALPLVPRHEACPAPVKLAVADVGFEAQHSPLPKPFARLDQLVSGKKR